MNYCCTTLYILYTKFCSIRYIIIYRYVKCCIDKEKQYISYHNHIIFYDSMVYNILHVLISAVNHTTITFAV